MTIYFVNKFRSFISHLSDLVTHMCGPLATGIRRRWVICGHDERSKIVWTRASHSFVSEVFVQCSATLIKQETANANSRFWESNYKLIRRDIGLGSYVGCGQCLDDGTGNSLPHFWIGAHSYRNMKNINWNHWTRGLRGNTRSRYWQYCSDTLQ